MPVTLSRQQLSDLYRQSRGFGENALSMLTGGIGEPVAGFASLAALARGEDAAGARDAVRDAFTYSPRTAEGQSQQRMLGELAQSVINSAPVRTWQRGVDFAGRASPMAGSALQTVPTAIGALTGYKPAMQTGRAVSLALAQAQRSAMENAMMPRVLHPQRGVFAGINAKTADLKALDSAKQMTASGVPADEIWSKTGWLVAPDGKWRFEIPDYNSELSPGSAGKLGDVLKHDDLYAAYPQLKDVNVSFDAYGSAGQHYRNESGSHIGLNPKSGRSIGMHEVQHEIQDIEGFSPGGNSDELHGYIHNGKALDGMDAYNRILGEVEARIVEARLRKIDSPKFADDLRDMYPYEEYGGLDVHPKNIIVNSRKK
jgi:hypothetical protein